MEEFADAHVHTVEMARPYADYGSTSLALSVTSSPGQWGALRDDPDPAVFRFYGVHPWYAEEWGPEAEGRLRGLLAEGPSGVGEIGLDYKRGRAEAQLPTFEAQLDVAEKAGRPVQIHMVGSEKDVLDSLRSRRLPAAVLHSFGSEGYSKPFADLGCYMSLNPRILARSPARVARLVSSVPPDRLLLESDFPFSPRGFTGMGGFAESLAGMCGADAGEMLAAALENARRAVGRA